MFHAHVEAQFESAHRNGPPGHKCAGTYVGITDDIRQALTDAGLSLDADLQSVISNLLDFHGHSWLAEIEWSYTEKQLDEYAWGPDFGAVKAIIRQYDHHNLNLMMKLPSAENLAKAMFEEFETAFGFPPDFVRLHEGKGNVLTYRADDGR
jgi:6-pyruvoyl-tetrahydropterin synthase